MKEIFCISKDCPLKEKCLRAMKGTVRKYGGSTSFIPAPFKIVNGKFECDMFQGDPIDIFIQEVKSIISNNKNHNN